ncbi:MAG: TonB-dependent receptor [Deltaproteobacteria bacterium]|nr:TonB-dependent receptor [Deltaproteobacteria bacterium]
MRHDFLLLLPAIACYASVVQAAELGSVRGRVLDDASQPVAGAGIVLEGVNVAGQMIAKTNNSGTFQILSVPPGNHELLVTREGFAPMRYKVHVRTNQSSFVPVTLQRADTAGEEIVVEEALPVIDATRSATSTELSVDLIQNLPVGRSFQDVTNMVPGVYGRVDTQSGGPSGGNPSVRGEGQYGNNYLIDGISTRDPATKTFGSDVNFDAIQEIQVYTDGLPAEFGEATGMLVNVVTKDGADEHFGSAAYFGHLSAAPGTYMILDTTEGMEVERDKRDFLNHELSLTAGGPIMKERLWYFAAIDMGRSKIEYEAMDPDHPYTSFNGQGLGKLTWFVNDDITAQYQVGYAFNNIENYETSGLYAPEAQALYESRDLTNILTFRWRPSASSNLELKLSSLNSSIDVVPASGEEEVPSVIDFDTGAITGNYDSFDYNDRSRLGGSLKFTQVVEDVLGDHTFKVGIEEWMLKDAREIVYTGSWSEGEGDGYQFWRLDSGGYPCTAGGDYLDCYGFTEYSNVGEPLGHKGLVTVGFLQDDWQIGPLTLNLGVRIENERLYQNEGDVIYDKWAPAPRLGAAWDVTGDSKTLVSVNAGRYYDLAGNTFADWGDTRSAYVYKEYQYDPSTGEYVMIWEQNPETNPLVYCTEQSLEYWDGEDPDMGALAREACNQYGMLKPYHTDKIVVGIEREILPLFAVGVKAILSQTRDIPEDVDYDLDVWVIANPESKLRDYRALEFTVEKKYDGVWQALASYTLSEAKGTTPGQFELASGGQTGSNGNEVGVYLDDVNDRDVRQMYFDYGYGWLLDGLSGLGTVDDDAGYYGYLPYHSFHVVKVAGSYTAPWGTTVGAVYEYDSGHAWQRRSMVELYGDYFGFPEGRGSRFMPAVHYFDLRAAHSFRLGGKRSVEVSVDAFNVLDLESPITYYENDNPMFGLTMYRQSPRSVRAGLKFVY